METNKLKKFAADARINLMDGVRRKLRLLGFDEKGCVIDKEPEWAQGATLWQGEEYPESFYQQWTTLRDRLRERGVREVVEEAAYTWFNRMMAIRILTKNDLCEPILRFDPATGLPLLLADARMGRVPEMSAQERVRFDKLMDDDNRIYDQFALLLTVWCHNNPIIRSCFGSIHDYVELLLPDNILRPDGFLAKLNDTPFITEDDYHSAELIGWLYQFYISDRKDEVFAKKGKVEAEEIPAATQIFTPNWIVKYMVENTILPQVDADEEVLEKAKYLVKTENPSGRKVELEELKVADFACGSGHILNECFDLLFALYRAESYSRREAIECIFTKNLTGIDIDLRAKQLATFALLLKACQQDVSFVDAHCMPHVITVPEMEVDLMDFEDKQSISGYLRHFFLGSETKDCSEQFTDAIALLKDADSLGSIIKFYLSSSTRRQLVEAMAHWVSQRELPAAIKAGFPVMDFILTLTDSYDAIVMNPPYMGGGKMDSVLSKYVKDKYKDGSADLATVFVEMAPQHLKEGGEFAFIIPPSWMFLSGFESLRRTIIDNYSIQSLLHLSRGVFGADFGASCAVIKNSANGDFKGTYFRLVERTFQEFDQKHLRELFEKVLENHEFKFLFKNYTKDVTSIEFSENGAKIYYSGIDQKQFEKIPGAPIAYWVSEKFIELFKNASLSTELTTREGMATADNDRYLRLWYEVNKFQFSKLSPESDKWYPYNKGGSFRKWFGNREHVVDWANNGEDIRSNIDPISGRVRSHNYNGEFAFKESLTWNAISSGAPCMRFSEEGFLWDSKGASGFTNTNYLPYYLGLLNSVICKQILTVLSPTLDFKVGDIALIPLIRKNEDLIIDLCQKNIAISKQDWDAHETSWDFQQSPLIEAIHACRSNVADLDMLEEEEQREIQIMVPHVYDSSLIEECINCYKSKWERLFFKLHANEEELNRQFIKIYGLEDELTPEVPFDEVTILQQGEITINPNPEVWSYLEGDKEIRYKESPIKWNHDVIIKQLISYIVGCYMGRYRLDRVHENGLHIAHPDPTEEELSPYQVSFTHDATFTIDSDGIIPILPQGAPFYDNLSNYVEQFVKMVWEEEDLQENMNFIEKCLGKPLNDYLMKDFWKYHKKMYQNRPIYWEFASKKGAFRALVYAHRMDRFTVEVLRSKYLLPYIAHIEKKVANMESRVADLSTPERRELDALRDKTLPELREYADRVEVVALQNITFDLDDGIIKNHALFGDIVSKLK